MEKYQLSLVLFLVTLLIFTSSSATYYLGCSHLNSVYNDLYPGGIGDINIEDCRVTCYRNSHLYSAIYEATTCFCLSSYNESSMGVCDLECPLVDAEKCGGEQSMSVYSQPLFIENYTIRVQDEESVFAFEEVNISTTFEEGYGTPVKRDIDFGDGRVQSCDASSCMNVSQVHSFNKLDDVVLLSSACDTEERNISALKIITVKSKLGSVRIGRSPTHVTKGRQFTFDVHIDSGTKIQLQVATGDSKTYNMTIQGSSLYKVGQYKDLVISTTQVSAALYLSPNMVFKYHGLIRSWDLNVKTPGVVSFQVFRPVCTYDFCLRSYSCLPWGVRCDRNQTNIWKTNCPTQWILTSSRCNGSESTFMPSSWEDMPIQTFEYVGENVFTATGTGLRRFTVPLAQAIRVQPGDMLAIQLHDQGLQLEVIDKSENYLFSVSLPQDWDQRNVENYTLVLPTDGYTGKAFDFHLSATVERTVVARFYHTYERVDKFNISATVMWDTDNQTYSNYAELDCQHSVENVTIVANENVTTNVVHNFTVADHPGTSHFYNWTWGDGNETTFLTNATTNHTYEEAGVYRVDIVAWNDVTSWSDMLYVVVQDEILNLTITPQYIATVYETPTHIQLDIDQGTNVTYLVDMGDGTVFEIQEVDGMNQNLLPTYNVTNTTVNDVVVVPVVNQESGVNETQNNVTPTYMEMTVTKFNVSTLVDFAVFANASVFHASFDYIYAEIGNYTMSVTVFNRISSVSINETYLPIQVPLTNLSIIPIEPIPFHDFDVIPITLGAGSAVTFSSSFNGNKTRLFIMSEFEPGNVTLEEQDYLVTGPHNLSVDAWNLVPPFNLTDTFTVWVEYIITDVDIILNTSYVRPYEAILFNVTMANGSRIDVFLDYDHDNAKDYEYRYDMLTGDLIQFEHIFVDVRHYNVCLSVINQVSNVTMCRNVTVQFPVKQLGVTTNSPIPVFPEGPAEMLFSIFYIGNYIVDPLPTDAFFSYEFGDGGFFNDSFGMVFNYTQTTSTVLNLNSITVINSTSNSTTPTSISGQPAIDNVLTTHAYEAFGTYNITLNISNFVSHMFFELQVVVDQAVQGLVVNESVLYVKIFENSTLCVTMTWGSRLDITWDYRDNTSRDIAPYDPVGLNCQMHTFNIVGVYDVMVITNNSVGVVNTTLELPIIVQKPIYEFTIVGDKNETLISEPDWQIEICFDIFRDVLFDFPTNVTFIVDFGDGSNSSTHGQDLPAGNFMCLNNSMAPEMCQHHVFKICHTYFFGDLFTVQLKLENLVSNGTFNFTHGVFEDIVNMAIGNVNEQAEDSSLTPGIISSFNGVDEYFHLESDLLLEATMDRGSLITFLWDFGDGKTEEVYNEKTIVHKYENPGTYTIKVNATNLLSEAYAERTITIQRSIKNSGIFTTTPRSRNVSTPFQVSAGTIGTDACYFINFVDVSSLDGHLLFLGNKTQCKNSFPLEFENPSARFESYSAKDFEDIREASPTYEPNVTVYNNFQNIGTYTIRLYAQNQVSNENSILFIGITRGPCSWPVVDLQNPNSCQPPFCDKSKYKMIQKSKKFVIPSHVTLNCKSTKIAHYRWDVSSVNDETLEETPYDMGMVETYSTKLTTLEAPKRYMPYGLYKICLNVSMDQEINIENVDCVFIRVCKTPLSGGVEGGLTVRKMWGTTVLFNAIVDSTRDPDMSDPTDLSGFTFLWLCRRTCEQWPEFNKDYTEITKEFTTNCTYFAPTGDVGGCSTVDMYNSSGLMANNTGSTFFMDLYNTYERDTLEIKVVIRKDDRKVTVSQFLEITDGPSPEVEITCAANCRKKDNIPKFNPDMKVSLQSFVKNSRRGVAYVYQWSLLSAELDQKYTDAKETPGEFWSNQTSTGLQTANLGIYANFFTHPEDIKKRFFISVRVYRQGSNPDNYGQATLEATINKPPRVGRGSINPPNGTALQTLFNTLCDGFIDEDLPLTYKIGYRLYADEDYKWMHVGSTCDMLTPKILPAGNEDDDFYIQFIFIATDYIGSSSFTEDAGVFVYKPQQAAVDSIVDSISSGESDMKDLASSGDVSKLSCTVMAISSTLNSKAQLGGSTQQQVTGSRLDDDSNMTTTGSPTTASPATTESAIDEEARKTLAQTQARSEMASALKNVPISDVSQVASLATAMTETLGDSKQLTGDAQMSGSAATDKTIEVLGSSTEDLESSETEAIAGSIMAVMGNSANAIADTKDTLNNEVSVSTDPVTTTAGPSQTKDQFLRDKLMAQTQSLSGFVSGKKVEGEQPSVISANGLDLITDKRFPDSLAGGSLDAKGGSGITMPTATDMYGTGNDTASSVTAAVVRAKKSPFPGQQGNETLDVDGNVVMLSVTDDTGSSVEAENTTDPTHIVITRDASSVTLDPVIDYTRDGDGMVIHKIIIPGKSSLHINVLQTLPPRNDTNETASNSTVTNYTTTTTGPVTTISYFSSTYSSTFNIPTTTQAPSWRTTTASSTTKIGPTTGRPMTRDPQSPTGFTTMSPFTKPPKRNISISSMNITNEYWTTRAASSTTPLTTTAEATSTATPGQNPAENLATTRASITGDDIFLTLPRTRFTIYVGINFVPTMTNHSFNCSLPLEVESEVTTTVAPTTTTTGSENSTASTTSEPPKKKPTGPTGTPDLDTCFKSNKFINKGTMVTIYFGIKSQKPDLNSTETTTAESGFEATTEATDFTTSESSSTTTGRLSRKRRSLKGNATLAPNMTTAAPPDVTTVEPLDPFAGPVYYKVVAYTAQCKYFSDYTQQWETDGCEVGPLTTPYKTHCICSFLTPPKPPDYQEDPTRVRREVDPNMVRPVVKKKPAAFGAAFKVPMNTINPADSAFLKLDSNPVIFSVMVALICLYLTTLIWAKKADRMDELKASSSPLLDNDPRHKYLYELTVYTGSKSRAGTTAKVSMVFSGDEGETDPRLIYDDKRPVLQKGSVDSFIMAESDTLGQLAHVRVWHDNSGTNPSWFFSRMVVRDLQTGEKFFFIGDKWWAVDEDEGLVDRVIPLAGREELTNFNHLFWTKTKKDLTDGHLWFSVFGRPAKSRFTRCQRLTCCISLLFSTMMANILFYDTDDGSTPQQVVEIGPISLSPQQILTGIYSSLIVFPINLLIVMLFRYAKAPKKKFKSAKKLHSVYKDDPIPIDPTRELQLQVEFLETGNAEKRMLKTPAPRTTPLPAGRSLKSPVQVSTISLQDAYEGEDEDEKTTRSGKKKKKFLLPHWFIYIGYVLCFGSCGAAFYMTVEVGGVFGAKKSNEWMVSFIVSIIESIFFTQPIKVLGLAVFYSLVIKKPDVEEDEEDIDVVKETGLQKGEEFLHKHHRRSDSKWRKAMAKMKALPVPPDEEYLKACKLQRQKENEMQAIIVEIIVYLFFLYLLLMIGYGNRDPWSNFVFRNVKNLVSDGHFSSSSTTMSFEGVTNYNQFWSWLNQTFVNSVYPDVWYNGKQYWFSQGFTQDRNMFMLGSPRLRLLRMPTHNCSVTSVDFPLQCREAYSMDFEDQGHYRRSWVPVNMSDVRDRPDEGFYWQNHSALDGYPYTGNLATYAGGGFTANLGTTKEKARSVLAYLKNNNWLDSSARAIFVEFVLYNPQVNLHAVSFMLLELLPTGAIYPMYKFYIMRLDQMGPGMLTVLVAEFLTICFTIFYMVREILKIKKDGIRNYFKDFWNKMEFAVTCLMITAVVMFFYRFVLAIILMNRYKEDRTAFINFQWTAGWDEVFGYVVAFIIFTATIKCLKLLRFNKKMSMLGRTLALAAGPIASFCVVFLVVFMAYTVATFIIFGRTLLSFSTFIKAAETLFSMMLNKFDYNSLSQANPVFAPLVFLSFVIFVTFMLLNFFLSMICDAFSIVKWETIREKNDYEIVSFMMSRFKSLFGFGTGTRLNFGDTDDGFVDDSSNELHLKIEGMLEWFSDYYNIETESAAIMDKLKHKNKQVAKEKSAKFIFQTN